METLYHWLDSENSRWLKGRLPKCRNPQTVEGIDIAASKVPKFVAGKALKEAVK